MGVEPMNTGFADQRVSHFAIGARPVRSKGMHREIGYCGCAVVRR
jgi:hypothetical protein